MSNQEKLKTDPRIKRTKKMFKEALISLIQEHEDASRLTVQMIADRAELNRATFYCESINKKRASTFRLIVRLIFIRVKSNNFKCGIT
ncbi:hypothetical protein L1999_04855 [Neobacillus drentensis]|uniref:hypothetical protein n=1 Tax=Neobacillus drentensis TaxID=220684 RepID=UPI001F2BC4EA|nr:hypothetical protein [Neobacillus drentensis]ULT59991.1 hypothetical protein L1999_04855 [Neobacillus drentensis]